MSHSGPTERAASPHGDRLRRLRRVCEEFCVESMLARLQAGIDVLKEQGVVDVAVLGQFKSGKSSFLNAIIGKDVLPVDVLPATAVITRIGHGPADRALVRHLSGESEEIPFDRLAGFVTERDNSGNEKQVSIVDVELPALEEFRGMRFVDTPGLGSVFAHNTKVSLEWLPRVGGALVAVSVNHPLSVQDLELLVRLFRHTPEAAILLTKADLVTAEQIDAITEFTRRQIASHTGKEVPILPFSDRPGFEDLRTAVRDHLFRRIVDRREETFDEIVGHKVRSLILECRQYLVMARRAAEAAGKARDELRDALSREEADFDPVESELGVRIRDLEADVRTASGERFHSHHGEVVDRLTERLREAEKGWKGNLSETTRSFRKWLLASIEEELAEVSFHGETHLAGFLLAAQASVQRTVRAFQDRLSGEIGRALGLPFGGARFHAEIEEPARPDVRVGKTFDSQVDLLWFLVPMGIFRPLVMRRFRKQLRWEAEKNLSRLSSQWADAVNRSIRDLSRQALEFMRTELATIRGLVETAQDRRGDIERALGELDTLEIA